MARWTISDGVSTYTFPVNPESGGSPRLAKRIHRLQPLNPDPGFTIRMAGRPEAAQSEIAGTVRTELHYTTLRTWAENKPVLTITDDLGRTFTVAVTQLTLTPAYIAKRPWRHHYSITYVLLSAAA